MFCWEVEAEAWARSWFALAGAIRTRLLGEAGRAGGGQSGKIGLTRLQEHCSPLSRTGLVGGGAVAGLAQQGGVGGLGLDPPRHDLRLLPWRGEGGHHIQHRRPPRLGDVRGWAIDQPLMLHQRRHAACTGGEEVEGVVGDVAVGLRGRGCGKRAEEQGGAQVFFQSAH